MKNFIYGETMKGLKFIILTIMIMSCGIITQARTNYGFGTNANDSLIFNVLSFTPSFKENNRCAGVTTPLSETEIDEIIRIHNEVRAQVGTAPLKWNCALAKFSQDWAAKDTFEHSTQEQRDKIISGGSAGENLSVDSSSTATMAALNKGWIDEKAFYDYNNNSCAAGKVCGHYTQMVWKTTNEIGCGVIRNSNSMGAEYKGQASYFVCTYYPGGNTDGEKPY
jgi:pathogenesis-related protein 1